MTDKVDRTKEKLLPCPFCGSEADPAGWLAGDGRRGPECEGCGATAESAEAWNRREQRPSNPLAVHLAEIENWVDRWYGKSGARPTAAHTFAEIGKVLDRWRNADVASEGHESP